MIVTTVLAEVTAMRNVVFELCKQKYLHNPKHTGTTVDYCTNHETHIEDNEGKLSYIHSTEYC